MHPPSAPPSPGLLPSRSLLLAVPTLNLLSSSSCHRPSRSNVGCFAYRSHECIARRLNSKYVIERPRTKPNPGCVHGFWIAAVILSNDLLPPIDRIPVHYRSDTIHRRTRFGYSESVTKIRGYLLLVSNSRLRFCFAASRLGRICRNKIVMVTALGSDSV